MEALLPGDPPEQRGGRASQGLPAEVSGQRRGRPEAAQAAVGCPWTATSDATWITIDSGTSGNGDGTVNYSVASNSGPARNGTMTIAQQTFTVSQSSGPLTITTTSPLPSGVVGVEYSQALSAAGGAPPYTWSLLSGQLPPGLSLSSGGALGGTPATAATYAFTVQVSGGGTASNALLDGRGRWQPAAHCRVRSAQHWRPRRQPSLQLPVL